MSDRYTRTDAEAALIRLIRATGARAATSYNDVGALALDYDAPNGGFVIAQISNIHGGQGRPFGHRRRTARGLVDAVGFALDVLAFTRAAHS